MGTLKKFRAGLSNESMILIPLDMSKVNEFSTTDYPVPTFKDTNGNSFSNIRLYGYTSGYVSHAVEAMSPYSFITPFATADLLEDYDVEDYEVTSVATITSNSMARTVTGNTVTKTHTLTISNTGSSAVTVGCIKFKRKVIVGNDNVKQCLVLGYYLDTPLSIGAGETKTLTIAFEI